MKNIDITHLITEQEIISKYEYFLEYTGEGDPVEQLIYMFWEGEEGYGNPYDLTEQEHDDLIRPVLEEYFRKHLAEQN